MAVLMREAIGGSLRRMRTARRRTLRDVSRRARVSLGYLSEVERGRKEPSSELLAAICEALDVALADLLSDAAVALDAAAAADAAATRPQRLVGLRHMDLRLAGADDAVTGPLHPAPAVPPLSPVAPVVAPASAQPVPGRMGAVRAAA
jgi:transcriptional regulator with XRE-family HTH domain